ncbi:MULTISPECIES: DUF7352 domain-containing protein [Bacillus]|nr:MULTISPECIES: hypothetical protein [Bacillus]MBP1083024.1 hypothetical protein [Bacillus capparidis]MED1098003.1 hypothetical protein [Bacillus capparidis]
MKKLQMIVAALIVALLVPSSTFAELSEDSKEGAYELREETIRKYSLDISETQYVKMPLGADILSTSIDHSNSERFFVHALVNTLEKRTQEMEFKLYRTDQDLDANIGDYKFLETVQLSYAEHLFHVFYIRAN